MSGTYKILDSFKLTGYLDTNFACGMSQDDRFFINSDTGLYILALKPNLASHFTEFSCHKYFLKPSSFAICDKVDLDLNSFVHELPKDMLYETIAKTELSQSLYQATAAEPKVLYADWSETMMVNGADCMLGILTNLYSLEIYTKSVNQSNILQYNSVVNLASELIEIQKANFIYATRLPPIQKMNEFRKRVEHIGTTAFCWSHTFIVENQTCSVIFLGHFTGAVSVFRIFSIELNESSARCDFLGTYDTKLGKISALYWHQTQVFGGGLCIGDSDGKIAILQITNLDRSECFMDNEIEFYSQKDGKVDKITMMIFGEHMVLIAVKQCYLLMFGISQIGKVFDFCVHNVDNFYVTGITHQQNKCKIFTFTGAFKELTVSVHLNKISIEEKILSVKMDFTGLRAHGFIESSNKILTAFLMSPCRLKNTIRGRQFIYIYLLNNTNMEPLKMLLENKSGSLRTYWDCFETLRLQCLKEQRFPWLGISPELDYDELSLHQLKTLRLIAKLSETVFNVVKKVVNYDIKPYILLHYLVDIKLIVKRINKLFYEKSCGRELSEFEMRSIDLQVFFLKEMVVSGILPKAKVGTTFIDEITHVLGIANEMRFPDMIQCLYCGEKLIGPTCLPPHPDSRCCFTMMPIFLAPSYKCPLCSSLAHAEVKREQKALLCPYCDFPMEKVCLDDAIQKKLEEFEKTEVYGQEIRSKCFSDCVTDSSEAVSDLLVNLEENNTDFVIFSDDSDHESEENKFKEIFFKLNKLNIMEGETEDLEAVQSNGS